MPLFKFEDFVFDSSKHHLTHRGVKVAIRPKASKLLNLLITNRHRIVSKGEIMSSVWGADYARDHLLFQLISELRKQPLKSDFVRTQPNEGYQWNIATKVIRKRFSVPHAIAASVIAVTVCLCIFALPKLNDRSNDSMNTLRLPAYSALTKGVIALENGEMSEALEWFEFALEENPDSVESSIFLAETLYQQNRFEESLNRLHSVLKKQGISAYNKATATNLISRISEQQGRYDDALWYAKKSIQTEVLGQCSVDFVAQQIQKLEGLSGTEVAMSLIPPDSEQLDAAQGEILTDQYIDQCKQLNQDPAETSLCQPARNGNIADETGAHALMRNMV